MDLPQEKVPVTQAEIDAAISKGGNLDVGSLGLGIKNIYTGIPHQELSKFNIGLYPKHKNNIAAVLKQNLKKILGNDITINDNSYFQPVANGITDYPCVHKISVKHPADNKIIIFNVTIEVLLEPMPANIQSAKASDPSLGPLRLKSKEGVVFTLSGDDALLSKYLLLGDFYNVFRYFPEDVDKTCLLLRAFNHPSIPLHSNDIMEEMIPAVIKAILPQDKSLPPPPGSLTQELCFSQTERSTSKNYRIHFQPALASKDYSGIGKLLIVSALLMGDLCKEYLETSAVIPDVNICMKKFCNETLKGFLYRLSDQAGCRDDMYNLITDIYNKTLSLKPGKFKDAFHAKIEQLATRLGRTTVKDLLPLDKIGSHVMSEFLSSIFVLDDNSSIVNWNLKSSKAMDYDDVATFLLRANANLENDFLTLQNVPDPFTFCEYLPAGFKQRWENVLHSNYSSMIFFDTQKWKLVEDPLNNEFDNEIQPCFFENLQDVSKKLLMLNFDRQQNRTLAEARKDVDLITKLKEKYPAFTICGVGFFNYPIPVTNAIGISAVADYDTRQSHSREACFQIDEKGLAQVLAHTLDSLNPGTILERPLLPMQQISVNLNKTPTVIPQQYQFCLFNLEKKQYCRVSYDTFMQRLTKRLRYDEILVQAKNENPQANLIVEQLFINDFGSPFLQIQIPKFLRSDLQDLLKERLQDIGARVGETYCELQILPLTSKYASWTEVTNPRFINYSYIITPKGTEKLLYLPDVLMRQFLDNLEEMLANAAYRQTNPVLQQLYKATQGKGAECWSYIIQICKEMVAKSQSGVLGFFGYKKEPTFEDTTDLLVYAIAHTEEHLHRYDELSDKKKSDIQRYKTDILISFCRLEIERLALLEWTGDPHQMPPHASNDQLMLLRNLKLALEKFPAVTIMNLKQLVIAEQKEQLKAFFAREVTRLTPRKEVHVPGKDYSDKSTNDKIAGYENISHYVDLHPLSHEITREVMLCLELMKVVSDGMYYATKTFPQGLFIGKAITSSTGYGKESTSAVNYRKTVDALTSTFTTPLWSCFKLGVQHDVNSEYRDWLAIDEPSEDKEQYFDDTPETPDVVLPGLQPN